MPTLQMRLFSLAAIGVIASGGTHLPTHAESYTFDDITHSVVNEKAHDEPLINDLQQSEVDLNNEFELTIDDLHLASLTPAGTEGSFSDHSFLYGSYNYPVSYETIALAELGINPFDNASHAYEILSPSIQLKDSTGELAYLGFNIEDGNHDTSHVLVGAHTRVPLATSLKALNKLDSGCAYTLLTDLSLLCEKSGSFSLANPEKSISSNQALEILEKDRKDLYDADLYALNEIEIESKIALNNLASFSKTSGEIPAIGAYSGQTRNGYGGITSPTSYLNDRYGGKWSRTEGASLPMPSFTMKQISTTAKSHCVPTAITRTFAHARDSKKLTKITKGNTTLFKEVRSTALKNGFKEGGSDCKTCGVAPNKIEGMVERVGDDQGYPKTDSKWIGAFTWNGTVKSSIKEKNPMILTFVGGTYKSHAVTVSGWASYKSDKGKTAKMIAVYDGWDGAIRWVDYDAFTLPGKDFTAASFYPVIVK